MENLNLIGSTPVIMERSESFQSSPPDTLKRFESVQEEAEKKFAGIKLSYSNKINSLTKDDGSIQHKISIEQLSA
jgi:hypothetical protein